MAPISGMMTSPTSDDTMAPKAAPMITPTARSTTLPFMAKSRNSFSIGVPLQFPINIEKSVDQPRMHHGVANRHARRLGDRHHRRPQLLLHLAEQRQRILGRRRVAFDEKIGVQRHQL